MKTLLRAIFLFVVCAVSILAQQKRLPSFEDYPANENYTGKVASIKLTSASAKRYRTVLREKAKQGVNFAGRYIIATFGCGTGCTAFAIIDAKTGNVHFSPLISYVSEESADQEEDRLQFREDSRLLIVAGSKNGEEIGKFYYEWKNNQLRLLRKTKL